MDIRKLIRESMGDIQPEDIKSGKVSAIVPDNFIWGKPKTPEESNFDLVRSYLIDAVSEERKVSEKAFSAMDKIIAEVDAVMKNSKTKRAIQASYDAGRRARLTAELIYSKWNDVSTSMNEEKTERQKLRDDQVKLTDEERAEVIVKGAVWDDGKPGVWKSQDKNGNIQYCSNTHRAMAVSKTLADAIKKFPEIKASA